MSGPDLLERVRMCLFDIGEDPSLVWLGDGGRALYFDDNLDERTGWRAREIVASGVDGPLNTPVCWSCFQAWPKSALLQGEHCLATRPCMEDCGLDRSAVAS